MASRKRPRIEYATELDEQLARLDANAHFPRYGSWSRTVREALGLPVTSLANRMKVSQSAVTKLEIGEEDRTITLARLEALADALQCDLVYAFLPRRSLAAQAVTLKKAQDEKRRQKRRIPAPE